MTMIRLPPTRIVPSRDDIHDHIEQVFERLYERLRASEPEYYDDDFGDDLASLIDADIPSSFRSSPAADEDYDSEASSAFDPDFEYKRYSSSQVDADGIYSEGSSLDLRVIEHPHRPYPRSEISDTTDEGSYGNGSYETAMESGVGMQEDGPGSGLPSTRMNYGELTRAPHSLGVYRQSFVGRRVASGTYQHQQSMHSLFPMRQINPRALFAFPEYSNQFPEIQQEVSSLRSLFDSLSLNTLPGLDHFRQRTKGKENQLPHSSDKEKTGFDSDLDSKLLSFNEAKTKSAQLIHPVHQTSPYLRNSKMPGSIQDERSTPQADVQMNDAPNPEATDGGSNTTLRISSTVFQNRGKRTRPSAGFRISAGTATKSSRRSSQTPSENEASSSSSKRDAHATGAASNQTKREVSQWTDLPRPTTRCTSWHPVNVPLGQNKRRQSHQAANRGRVTSTGQGTSRTTHGSRPVSIQGSAPSASNNVQRPATSTHATPATQTQPSTAQLAPTATAPAGINMPPQTALSPEKWKHMMEVSQVYREHVNQMRLELDKDEDNANGFGLVK